MCNEWFPVGRKHDMLDDDLVTIFVGWAKKILVELFLVQKSGGDSVWFSRFLQKTKFFLDLHLRRAPRPLHAEGLRHREHLRGNGENFIVRYLTTRAKPRTSMLEWYNLLPYFIHRN